MSLLEVRTQTDLFFCPIQHCLCVLLWILPPQESVTCCFGVFTDMEKKLCHLLFGLFIVIVIIITISILTGRLALHTKQTQLPTRQTGIVRLIPLYCDSG